MDPQQELFTAIREILVSLHGEDNVYDEGLPPEGAKYPFDYIGENFQHDTPNKSAVFGRITQTIHVYHNNPARRGDVSKRLLNIKKKMYKIHHTKNFAWRLDTLDQRVMADNTTGSTLIHGILELHFNFS